MVWLQKVDAVGLMLGGNLDLYRGYLEAGAYYFGTML